MALLELLPVIDQQVVEVDIERDAGKAPALGAEAALHRLHPRMGIGKAIHRAMILQPGEHRLRQAVLIQAARKIPQQITYRRLQRRLRQYQVREMIHARNYKTNNAIAAIGKIVLLTRLS